MGEFISDPLTGKLIIYAFDRAKRTDATGAVGGKPVGEKVFCNFEEGNESGTPPEIFRIGKGDPDCPGWEVRVVPNKYPVTSNHLVIIHSPSHENDWDSLNLEQIQKVFQAFKSLYEKASADGKFPFWFYNVGREAGASLVHPHSQFIAFDFIPPSISEELQSSRSYEEKNASCYFCDMIAEDTRESSRTLLENDSFVLIAPKFSRWPYEFWLLPKRHAASPLSCDSRCLEDMAKIYKSFFSAFRKLFPEAALNFWLHSVPNSDETYHWHIEFFPRLKVFAGIELGAGIMVNDRLSAEDAASKLRSALP